MAIPTSAARRITPRSTRRLRTEMSQSCRCCSMRGRARRRPATTGQRRPTTRARKVTRPSRSSCRAAARDESVLLDEHPAMAFEVFGSVEPAIRVVLRLREDRGSRAFCPREVGVHAVHLHAETVNHPGYGGPSFGGGACLAMALRTLVVGCRSGEEDPASLEIEFRVTDRPICGGDSFELPEPEGPDQPIDRCRPVLIRNHRHNPRPLGAGFLDHGSPGAKMSWGLLNAGVLVDPAGVGFVRPVRPCTFAFPRYKLIYYMNSYLSRNATASRASQTDPQRADLGHVAHGGIRPSEV